MACLRKSINKHVLLDNGRFETIAPLNHGSFGMVFTAKDLKTGNTVAIKCLTKRAIAVANGGPNLAFDDKSEELELHRRLGRHDNIVSLVHSFESEAHMYLVLEFCPRGDLYESILKSNGPSETARVRQFMHELVDAVEYMHSKGISHRDIKPENIFLTLDGTPKLGDFGLATTETWSMENAVGSDRYMSPEQFDSAGAGFNPGQADIWALGICLLNILFQRNPFEQPTEADRIFLDYSRDRQSLFDVFPSMSQDTFAVLMQCMSMDPKKRSLSGLRTALDRVVSFTTDDDLLDDFLSNDTHAGASTNREPLRTPSLQSPKGAADGAFPWHRALRTHQLGNRLDTIVDDESMLAQSAESSTEWFMDAGNTPSTASVLDSQLGGGGASVPRPIHISRPMPARSSAVSGSLPIAMARPRMIPKPSSVFIPHSQGVSKSWSDMWEEDEEEEELEQLERARQLALQQSNSRTYSEDSSQDVTVVQTPVDPVHDDDSEDDTTEIAGDDSSDDGLDELVEDGFFVHDTICPSKSTLSATSSIDMFEAAAPRRSAIKESLSSVDKWAALGERRRAYTGDSDSADTKSPGSASRRHFPGPLPSPGSAGPSASIFGNGHVWEPTIGTSAFGSFVSNKDRARDRPSFNKSRDWNWRRDAWRINLAEA